MTEVRVYTWPYQWVYQPVYVALAALQKEMPGQFIVKYEHQRTGQVNASKEFEDDEAIRQMLAEEGGANDSIRIAVCEPPVPDEKFRFRVIPLLWRLPVWLFGPAIVRDRLIDWLHSQPKPTSQPEWIKGVIPPTLRPVRPFFENKQVELHNYKESATTGRLGDQLFKNLRPDIQPTYDLPEKLGEFIKKCEEYRNGQIPLAASYTPIHFIIREVGAIYCVQRE